MLYNHDIEVDSGGKHHNTMLRNQSHIKQLESHKIIIKFNKENRNHKANNGAKKN